MNATISNQHPKTHIVVDMELVPVNKYSINNLTHSFHLHILIYNIYKYGKSEFTEIVVQLMLFRSQPVTFLKCVNEMNKVIEFESITRVVF